MLRATVIAALAAGLFACAEDPAPPNKPVITSAEAVCRPVEGVQKLDQVTVVVQDLDGVADLTPPLATVVATALPMEGTPSDADAVDPSGSALECEGAEGQCVMRYTWRRSDTSEQIFCGEDGDLLEIVFEVADIAGFWTRVAISTNPL